MPPFEPQQRLETPAVTLRERALAGPWGEVWRATHDTHGPVFAVLCRPGSRAAAQAARLDRWQRMAEHVSHLAPIREMDLSASQPYLLVADSGGLLLSQRLMNGPLPARDAARLGATISHALVGMDGEGILPIGVTPNRVLLGKSGGAEGAVLLPFPFPDAEAPEEFGENDWLPPMPEDRERWERCHSDVYGVGLIVMACVAGGSSRAPSTKDLKAKVPHTKLSTTLSNFLVAQGGVYPEAKVAVMMLERWIARDAVQDEKELAEARADAERKPLERALHRHRSTLVKVGGALAAVLVVVLLGMGLVKVMTSGSGRATARGAARLYFEALVDRNAGAAEEFADGEAKGRAQILLNEVARIEGANLASRFASVVAPKLGDATVSPVQGATTLVGENGDGFMKVEFVLMKNSKGEWHVARILWDPLVKPPEP